MRIAHYFFRVSEASGGVSRAIYDLVGLLASGGHQVTLATGKDSQFPEGWCESAGANVDRLLLPPTGPFQRLGHHALEKVATIMHSTDVLHLHGLWRPSSSQVAALARKLGVPYVLTPHGTLDRWSMQQSAVRKRVYYTLFERRNLDNASRIHCTAEAEVEQCQKWVSHKRFATIPYAVDLEPYRELPPPELFHDAYPEVGDGPSVLFLSRLHYKKGAEILIEAVGRLRRNGVNCELWFAGTGDDQYVQHLRALASRHVPNAHFLGLVTGQRKLSLYRCADVLALPTQQENFALVLTEALGCGTPVVTTRGTDIWRELRSGGGATIVEPTPEAFANAIGHCLANRENCRVRGAKGRRWLFRWLDPERIMEQFEELYSTAIQHRRIA